MKKFYTFVLNFGYVESARLSYLPWTSLEKFSDAKVALIDLASFLKEKYLEGKVRYVKKCCADIKEKDVEAIYCSKCGTFLFFDKKFDVDDYMRYVSGINDCDIDTFHGDYMDLNDDHRWEVGELENAFNNKSQVRFVYQAEQVLAAAIGHSPNSRRDIEKIFEERSRSGGNSFSFW